MKEEKTFMDQFPSITEQEILTQEVMDSIEGGSCEESCLQGCKKRSMGSGNHNGTATPVS